MTAPDPGMMMAESTDAVAVLTATVPIPDSVEAVSAAAARDGRQAVTIIIPATMAQMDRAMLAAAIGPLAIAHAPVRVNAIDCTPDAEAADVAALAAFLASAACTTGEVVRVGNGAAT